MVGDQFMALALPLLAVTVLGASASLAALLPFALYAPFWVLGLPAGAIVDRVPRRTAMLLCDGVQALAFLLIATLAATHALSFPLLLVLVVVAGCATVFFQVAYTSVLPEIFTDQQALHRGNTRLSLSESVSRSVGPILAGPVIALTGAVAAIALDAGSFVLSALTLSAIRRRSAAPAGPPRERGWLRRDIAEGLRFVLRHGQLQPVILCGTVYVLFLSMIEASLVLYCRNVLGLDTFTIGLVVGAAALGFPLGNLVSARLMRRFGPQRALMLGALVSVAGIVAMPVAGSAGSVVGLVVGSVVHGVGEGAFGPTSLTLRQTVTPAALMGRVGSVQRLLVMGAIPAGSLLAAAVIQLVGLPGVLWVGGLGTVLCLPVLVRRDIRAALRA
ncbi:MFS transporter [Solihabitans fulvus]|uniref:MFS transporter n=2 Tax=Solihabitans fulvus TaxID=1892852 RepID=A0A5B2XGJ5_9PSEU|nr:MFS transporter [Solihabitans fulvus]